MAPTWAATALAFSSGVGVAFVALTVPHLEGPQLARLSLVVPPFSGWVPWASRENSSTNDATFHCQPPNYTAQLVSLDPLVVYLRNFLHPSEINDMLAATSPLLKPSTVTKYGVTVQSEYRSSWSAEVPPENPAVQCIEDRVWAFMGTVVDRSKDAIEPPQMVRYTAGQKFDMHNDWYERPQPEWRGRRRAWNRIASFLAILHDNCTEGETYFPHIRPVTALPPEGWAADSAGEGEVAWKPHEKGGLMFRPIKGNALFWMNLHNANGTGDARLEHAGLPVKQGVKVAINIWPRRYTGPDAWARPSSGRDI